MAAWASGQEKLGEWSKESARRGDSCSQDCVRTAQDLLFPGSETGQDRVSCTGQGERICSLAVKWNSDL